MRMKWVFIHQVEQIRVICTHLNPVNTKHLHNIYTKSFCVYWEVVSRVSDFRSLEVVGNTNETQIAVCKNLK